MRRYGEKLVPERVILDTVCDQCGKRDDGEPDGWVTLKSHHDDWDSDIDSWVELDACSTACLVALISRVVDDYAVPETWSPTLSVRLGEMDYRMARELAGFVPPGPVPDDARRFHLRFNGSYLGQVRQISGPAMGFGDELDVIAAADWRPPGG